MIDSIEGVIVKCTPAEVLLKTMSGLTFQLYVSVPTSRSVRERMADSFGYSASLYTHTQILTNDPQARLFGFSTEKERSLFRLLISIKGVGPSAAIKVLSGASLDQVKAAIQQQNAAFFTKIKGIGKKIAERIVFDLKDKFDAADVTEAIPGIKTEIVDESLEALKSLGFKIEEAKKAIEKAQKKTTKEFEKSDELVVAALGIL